MKDWIFVVGVRGMVGSVICRVLFRKGYGDEVKSGVLLVLMR